MPASGPKYLPCSVIAAWRCFTRISGFTCATASTTHAAPKDATTVAAKSLRFIVLSPQEDDTLQQTPVPRGLFRASAQSRSVLGDRPYLAVVHVRGHAAHDAVRIISARSLAKRLQLGPQILGVLPGEPWILRRNAGTCRTVATGACRNAFRRIAAAPDLLSQGDQVLIGGDRGLELLGGIVGSEALDVGLRKIGHHAHHHRAFARRLLAVLRLEIAQLLFKVFGELAGELRVRGRGAVAIGGVTRRAHLHCDALPSRQVGSRGQLLRERRASTACGETGAERQETNHR